MSQTIIAIDFGTSNTYISKSTDTEGRVNPIDIEGRSNTQGILSLMVYTPNQTRLIGYEAAEELVEMDEEDFQQSRIRAQFKPDIAYSTEAEQTAIDFLDQVRQQLNRKSIQIDLSHARVIFGVPSNASIDYKNKLKKVAKMAGWGDIELLDEPIAALCYHLSHGEIQLQNILSNGLIIDFGGGTCDFVWINQGNIKDSWGSNELGGRLFDDLFFQLIKEQNTDINTLNRSDLHFIRYLKSKEAKEKFSHLMLRDRNISFKSNIFQRKNIQIKLENIDIHVFEDRAKHYQLSNELKEQFTKENINICSKLSNECDLFQWFISELNQKKWAEKHVDFVILAGGSSLWYFVKDILISQFKVDPAHIFRSARPFAAISEGLAVYPHLLMKLQHHQKTLQEDLPRFLSEDLSVELSIFFKEYQNNVKKIILNEIFHLGIRSILEDFRANGGKIKDLENKIQNISQDKSKELEEKLALFTKNLIHQHKMILEEKIKKWFKSYGVDVNESIDLKMNIDHQKEEINIFDFMFQTIETSSYIMIASLSASIFGGTGTALIMTGPLGLLIGAAIGLVGVWYVLKYGKDKAKEYAKEIDLPAMMVKGVLRESHFDEIKEKLSQSIDMKLDEEFKLKTNELLSYMEKSIEAYIKQIKIFQNLSSNNPI